MDADKLRAAVEHIRPQYESAKQAAKQFYGMNADRQPNHGGTVFEAAEVLLKIMDHINRDAPNFEWESREWVKGHGDAYNEIRALTNREGG